MAVFGTVDVAVEARLSDVAELIVFRSLHDVSGLEQFRTSVRLGLPCSTCLASTTSMPRRDSALCGSSVSTRVDSASGLPFRLVARAFCEAGVQDEEPGPVAADELEMLHDFERGLLLLYLLLDEPLE